MENGETVELSVGKKKITAPFCGTFGDVSRGEPLIMKDDYRRIEVAVNCGSFAENYPVSTGNRITITAKPE